MPTLVQINDTINNLIKPIVEPKGEDYWQTPTETFTLLTGDCEDISIAKYYSCLVLGYTVDRLELQCVRLNPEYPFDTNQSINHMVLVVDDWCLDNYAKQIVKISDRKDITEVYATIRNNEPCNYKQYNEMLNRRDEYSDKMFIRSIFGLA